MAEPDGTLVDITRGRRPHEPISLEELRRVLKKANPSDPREMLVIKPATLRVLLDTIEAAAVLSAKVEVVDHATAGIFTIAAVHACEYKGPNYGEELLALRALLARLQP